MTQSNFKVYSIRWFMLIIYMLLVASNQLLWITFAPITGDASRYYVVSDLRIGILSMCFMIVFLLFIKEAPPNAPCLPEQEERSLVLDGFMSTIRTKDFIWLSDKYK